MGGARARGERSRYAGGDKRPERRKEKRAMWRRGHRGGHKSGGRRCTLLFKCRSSAQWYGERARELGEGWGRVVCVWGCRESPGRRGSREQWDVLAVLVCMLERDGGWVAG